MGRVALELHSAEATQRTLTRSFLSAAIILSTISSTAVMSLNYNSPIIYEGLILCGRCLEGVHLR